MTEEEIKLNNVRFMRDNTDKMPVEEANRAFLEITRGKKEEEHRL